MAKRKRSNAAAPTADKQAKTTAPAVQNAPWHGMLQTPNHPPVTPAQQRDCRTGTCQHCQFLQDIKFKHDLLFSPATLGPTRASENSIDKEDDEDLTIRQDNAAFEMICDLESERDQVQIENKELQTKLATLQAQLDQANISTNKDNAAINGKNQTTARTVTKVYVVHYHWAEFNGFALGHGTRSSIEDVYATLSDANDAAKRVYQQQNRRWNEMKMEKVRMQSNFYSYRRHDDPDSASKSTTDEGEVHYTFRLEASGRGVVQVQTMVVL